MGGLVFAEGLTGLDLVGLTPVIYGAGHTLSTRPGNVLPVAAG